LPAKTPAALWCECRHRAQDPQLIIHQRAGLQEISQLLQEKRRLLVVVIFRADDDVAGPRRQLHGLAFGQRLFGKGVIAFMQQGLQQRMLRVVRLQHHFALFTGATGTPCHLGIKLGEALG